MTGRRLRTLAAVAAIASSALLAVPGVVGPAAALPLTVTERVVLGTSVQGRPIVAYHRYTVGSSARPFLVVGQMHGDEETGRRVVAALRQVALPDDVDLWLIPTMNPDGDRRDSRTNARGVDLNRNFPHRWVEQNEGTRYWSGPRAASEPETRAVRDFVADLRPWRTVSFHTPLYGVDSSTGKDPALVRDLARWSGYPIRSFTCSTGCRGTMTQFINGRTPGAAVTFEFGPSTSSAQLARVVSATLRVGRS